MKVLIIANYAKEHINKFHISTIKAFKNMGWQVDVACNADAEIPYCDNVYDIPLERNPFRPQTLQAISMLKKIIAREKYDVVHCHTFSGKVAGILASSKFRKQGLKVIYTSHGFQYYKGASFLSWMLFLPLDKWLVSKTDLLIAINDEDYQTAIKHNFPAKTILKNCGAGIKLDKFLKDSNETKHSMREKLAIPNDAIVLIYVAELCQNKNQYLLVDMFEALEKKIDNLYMLLPGPDHSNGNVQKYIGEKGFQEKIKCLGWRDDIPDLIRASDFAVASSTREGFGVNLLEYMSCDIPVVAIDNRGHREIIENGTNGFLVSGSNEMAEKIYELYNNESLSLDLCRNAKKTVEYYSDTAVVNRLIEIYNRYLLEEF